MATANELLLMKMKQEQDALAKKAGAPAVPTAPPGGDDLLTKMKAAQDAEAKKALGTPDGSSPYDTVGGTLTQIGKILGSGLEQAGTSIAGMPAASADMYNAGLDMLPEGARPYVEAGARALNPTLAISQAARSLGAPTGPEMDAKLREKGLQYAPEPGSLEDWAQYITSAAAQGAVPIGQSATLANAGKGALMSILPAAAGKGGSEAASVFTDSPMLQSAAGIGASIIAALGQHGVKTLANPSVGVAKQLGEDVGPAERATFEEYKRLGVPAMAADLVPPTSTSSAAIRGAVTDNPRGKAQFLLDELANREKSAGTRIKGTITDAVGSGDTASRHILNIEKEADAIAKPIHDDVRVSDLYSNNSKAVREIIPYLRGQADTPTPVQAVMTKVAGFLTKTNENGVPSPNLEAQGAWAAREYIKDVVAKNPEMETYLKPIFKKLNGALQLSYDDLPKADNALALRDLRVGAVNAGKKAATSKMDPADVQAEFKALGEKPNGAQLQQDYQIGYGSTLRSKVGNTKTGTSGVAGISSKDQGEKISTVLGPDEAQRRDFEITADTTKRNYTVKPNDNPGLMERIRHLPGHGFGAVSMGLAAPLAAAGLVTGNGAIGLGLGATSGIIGLVKALRDPAVSKSWLKAAGIKDPKELEKFLLSAQKHGTFSGAAGKAGIINAINSAGR